MTAVVVDVYEVTDTEIRFASICQSVPTKLPVGCSEQERRCHHHQRNCN